MVGVRGRHAAENGGYTSVLINICVYFVIYDRYETISLEFDGGILFFSGWCGICIRPT